MPHHLLKNKKFEMPVGIEYVPDFYTKAILEKKVMGEIQCVLSEKPLKGVLEDRISFLLIFVGVTSTYHDFSMQSWKPKKF